MCECRSLVKYILFLVNLLCVLVGVALIGLGVAVIMELNDLLLMVPINLEFVPYSVIALGVIVFLIAFSGCCGAITETKFLLITYAVCMAILAAVKIYVAVMLSTNLSTYTSTVENYVDKAFDDPALNETFHGMETLLKCCGTHGPDSYVNEYNLVSPTCCENATNISECTKEEAYQTGCTTMIGDYFNSFTKNIVTVLIVIIISELVAMASSIYLVKTIQPKYDKKRYY